MASDPTIAGGRAGAPAGLRAIAGALCLLLVAACGGSGGGSGDDDGNGSDTNATAIGGAPVAGVIDSADGGEQLFTFVAPADGVYRVALDWANAASDLDLLVTDGADNYFTLNGGNSAESINVAMAANDVLAVAVTSFSTAGAENFTLAAASTAQPAHVPGMVESEPNDEVASANLAGLGQAGGIVSYDRNTLSGADEQDLYVYLVSTSATYTITLTWVNAGRDLDLAVGWGANGFASSTQGFTESESITQAFAAAEQLRILVQAFNTGGAPVSYNLTIEPI